MTASARHRYSSQLSELQRLNSLEQYSRLRIETVVVEETMAGGEGKDDLCWTVTCNEMTVGFLGLDSTQDLKEIHQYDTMREFGLVVDAADFTTALRDGNEWGSLVQDHAQRCVDVDLVHEGFRVPL
jgi:hypothetical protein